MGFVRIQSPLRKSLDEEREGKRKVADAQRRNPNGNLFLSHQRADDDYVAQAIEILEGHGGTVYVDKKDQTLATMSNEEKAAALRGRILSARKFVVLLTENTSTSRWIPWELGVADPKNTSSYVATLPFSTTGNEENWGTQEYFALYPQIRYGVWRAEWGKCYYVVNVSRDRAFKLDDWLSY